MPLYCSRCGKENEESARFCPKCGTELEYRAETAFLAGPVILDDRYEIIATVKAGAMGRIFKARDIRLDSIVAVKEKKSSPEFAGEYTEARFREEAMLLSTLSHEGLPRVTDYFTIRDPATGKGVNYIVMDFIEGKDLETIIDERGKKPFPQEEVLDIFEQILDIFRYLHTRQPPVIYRDLNPRNIMIRNGKVYLVDFGIARLFRPERRGTAIGTAGYAPPEQYKGKASPRSDLYSLGAVIHYLLTGSDPEDRSNELFTFEQAKELNPAVPAYLDSLLMSMLDIVPDRRPVSVDEILSRLHKPRQALDSPMSAPLPKAGRAGSGDLREITAKYDDLSGAVFANDAGAVVAFLDSGADVNEKNLNGFTPLHIACSGGHRELVDLLISRGADVHARSNRGWSCLYSAVIGNHLEIVTLLVTLGVAVNSSDDDGVTLLHWAADKGHIDIVRYLISYDADVKARSRNDDTPLHFACRRGQSEVAELLIKKGARVSVKNSEGQTPLHLASLNEQKHTAELLLYHHADANARNMAGQTPLQVACNREIKSILGRYGGR